MRRRSACALNFRAGNLPGPGLRFRSSWGRVAPPSGLFDSARLRGLRSENNIQVTETKYKESPGLWPRACWITWKRWNERPESQKKKQKNIKNQFSFDPAPRRSGAHITRVGCAYRSAEHIARRSAAHIARRPTTHTARSSAEHISRRSAEHLARRSAEHIARR